MPVRRSKQGNVITSVISEFATTFPATETPISQGGIWLNGAVDGTGWNNAKTTGVGAFAAAQTFGFDDAIACLKTSFRTFAANQFAQGVVSRAGSYAPTAHEIELLLRFAISANVARGYEVLWGVTGECNIVRWNGALNDFSAYNGASGPNIGAAVDGDVLRAEVIGSVVKVYKNGSLVNTAISDTTWATGQPGLGFWPHSADSVLTSYGWKSYTAGDL